MEETTRRPLDQGVSRLLGTVGPSMKALMGYPVAFGTLMVLPILLFLVVGTSRGLHWWRVPWPGGASAGLLWLMAADAALVTALFGFFSGLFFLGLWRGKLGIPGDRRPFMAYTYLVTAPQYGLIALWGGASVTGRDGHLLLDASLILYLVSSVVKPWLKLLQKAEAK